MKRPSFQFYPGDWLNDEQLQMCSWNTQGLWINLICRMYRSDKIGYLYLNGRKLDAKEIQKLSKMSPKMFQKCWDELTTFGVVLYDENYGFYSKRIIEDERLRELRADSGKRGGNPNLVNQNPTTQLKQNPTPSSSSPSSSSNNLESSSVHVQNDDDLKDFPKETRDAMMSATLGGITYFTKHVKGSCIPKTKAPEFVSDLFVRAKKTNPRASPSQIKAAWEKTCDAAIKYNGKKPKYFETTFNEKLSELISGGQRL